MKDIKVLGSGCANCKTTIALIEQVAQDKGVEIKVDKVQDMQAIIGYGVLSIAADEAHLLNIGVAARHHGQGYGARLLRNAMQAARQGGATKLFLEVRPSNERAVELYRHFGFRQIGLRKGYYPAAIGREDALIFDKELA